METKDQLSATAKQVQNNIKKAAISEYKHCKSIHLKEGQVLNFCFTFQADSSEIQSNLINVLKDNGFNPIIMSSKFHSKKDTFLVLSLFSLKLELKTFITKSAQLYNIAYNVGAEYLYFEIDEVLEFYSLGINEENIDVKLVDSFEDSKKEQN